MQPDFSRERALGQAGCGPVAGIDEAGRGPLAGPVVAAAVILDPRAIPKGLADSKTLSANQRESLSRDIMARAHALAIACATAQEIDVLNIRRASLLAMQRAIDALAIRPGHCLVDGRDVPDCGIAATAIIRGDATVASIAAASILAKVARDRMMAVLAQAHPQYGFERHAGYPTRLHRRAIAEFGPCLAHRRSFRLLPE